MGNIHTVFKSRSFKIENYTINKDDGNKITYSIVAEISFSDDCIDDQKYSVNIQDSYGGNDLVELYSGTLLECRKEIKRLIASYWSDAEFDEEVMIE